MRGHIRKRGSKWAVVVDVGRDTTGKRQQRWFSGYKTKGEASRDLARIITDLGKGAFVAPDKVTVADFLTETWLPSARATIRPTTFLSYQTHVQKYLVPHLGAFKLQKLTPAAINKMYAGLVDTARVGGTLSPSTVRRIHATLRRAMRDAVRWQLLGQNVADQADPPRVTRPQMQVWTAEQLRAFLTHVEADRLSFLYLLLATTGLRRGEALGLRWSDLDLDQNRLAVRQTLIPVGHEVMVGEPKTAKGRRSVALDAGTVTAAIKHRRKQAEERLSWGAAYVDSGLVFTRENGVAIHPDWFSHAFARHVVGAGLAPLTPHGLRHTHASLALAAGVHPKVVSERLGHSTISVTLDLYTHSIPALEEEAAERVAALLRGVS